MGSSITSTIVGNRGTAGMMILRYQRRFTVIGFKAANGDTGRSCHFRNTLIFLITMTKPVSLERHERGGIDRF
jgi:hypothetical protein